jgi:hypothetical protein
VFTPIPQTWNMVAWTGTAYKSFTLSSVEDAIGWGINNANLITLYAINSSGLYDACTTPDLTTLEETNVGYGARVDK